MTTPGGAAGAGPGDEAVRAWFAARERAEARRDAVLASDDDREKVCHLLSGAFGEGRLTSAELDQRTSRALAARTHGDLDDVLEGLTGPGTSTAWNAPRDRGLLPRIGFWVVAFLTSPFIFIATVLLLFGDGFGTRVWALVMLVIFLPGPVALYRWSHPRR